MYFECFLENICELKLSFEELEDSVLETKCLIKRIFHKYPWQSRNGCQAAFAFQHSLIQLAILILLDLSTTHYSYPLPTTLTLLCIML